MMIRRQMSITGDERRRAKIGITGGSVRTEETMTDAITTRRSWLSPAS